MSNLIFVHPGIFLILMGVVIAIVPEILRKPLMLISTGISLVMVLSIKVGTELAIPFINGYSLYLIEADKLSLVFAFVFALISVVATVYSFHAKGWQEPLAALVYAGASIGVTLAGDWMTMIFFWELMAASSLFLVWINHTEASTKAGFRYLLVHMTGGNFLLAGIILKVVNGETMISCLTGTRDTAYWLILIGVAINAAIPPIHAWIVDAYPESTITGVIFMNSFTTKVAVYALIRLFAGSEIFLWLGVIMAIYGAAFALIENDMRRLLSYHIVSQVGFMVAAVGIGTELALNGAAAHAFGNIIFKSLLFMCVGAIIYSTGVRKISELGGLRKKMPFVFACFCIAALSIACVPFLNGFISKPLITTAALESGRYIAEILLQIAGIGTFYSITMKMTYFIFFGEAKKELEFKPIPLNMKVAMAILSVACVVYGLCPNLLYNMLPYAMEYNAFDAGHILQYFELLTFAAIPFVMFLAKMAPHDMLTLDLDWFYRRPFASFVKLMSSLVVTMQLGLGDFFRSIFNRFRKTMQNPLKLIRVENRELSYKEIGEDEYDPDATRDEIGDVMVVVLLTLLIGILFLVIVV